MGRERKGKEGGRGEKKEDIGKEGKRLEGRNIQKWKRKRKGKKERKRGKGKKA